MKHEMDIGQEVRFTHDGPLVVDADARHFFFTAMAHRAATQYIALRQGEYPPITDYLDGVVKGDQAQIDAYIAACQAVKAKYPKPVSADEQVQQ